MAEEVTAVLEPEVTAVSEGLTTPVEILPDSVPAETPDSDTGESPDSDTEATEEPSIYSKEEVDKMLAAELAKERESTRRKQETAAKEQELQAAAERYEREVQLANDALTGGVQRGLAQMFKEQGLDPSLDPELAQQLGPKLAGLGNWYAQAQQTRVRNEWGDSIHTYLSQTYPEFRIPPEANRALQQAFLKNNPLEMLSAIGAIQAAAIKEMDGAVAVTETAEAQELARQKAGIAKAKSEKGPTSVNGQSAGGGLSFRTQLEVDTAFAAGKIGLQEVRRQLARNLPYS